MRLIVIVAQLLEISSARKIPPFRALLGEVRCSIVDVGRVKAKRVGPVVLA